MSSMYTFATWEQYLIYLRKSRSDNPNETIEEVLAKHEIMLQEYAVREFGHKIPEENIYREVVSGESIESREEIKKILSRIEDPNIKGVIVVEPSRLSRGDLLDCGRLINDLRYTKTLVVTPYMTYDLENKMERKFFQDELLRGNDYLEYTKEILWRGRVAAAKRGCYVSGPAPFGYKKIKDGKDWILEVVPENAEIVRMMFDWVVKDGIGLGTVATKLTEMGVKSPAKGGKWRRATVSKIISNEHYLGKVVFNRMKQIPVMEDGKKVIKRVLQSPEDIIVAKGKHPAIVDTDIWEAAQRQTLPEPRVKKELYLKNPLSMLLRCGKCGAIMNHRVSTRTEYRYECRQHKPKCYKSVKVSELNAALIMALEESELPALKLKMTSDEGNAEKIQQRLLTELKKELADLEEQEEKQFELLEKGIYTQELFERRHGAIAAKIRNCKEQIEKTRKSMPRAIDYKERAATLEEAIKVFKDTDATPYEKNKLLKTIIDRIEYYGVPFDTVKQQENPFTIKVFLRL